MRITDIENNPLDRASDSVRESSSNVRTIRIETIETGFVLVCNHSVDDVTVEGRLVGDSVWIDLETIGIDLSPYTGTSRNFEIRYTAGSVYGGNPISDTNPFQNRIWDFTLRRL
jgi:hypothetical protein